MQLFILDLAATGRDQQRNESTLLQQRLRATAPLVAAQGLRAPAQAGSLRPAPSLQPLALTSAPVAQQRLSSDYIVAVVGSEPVTNLEVNLRLQSIEVQLRQQGEHVASVLGHLVEPRLRQPFAVPAAGHIRTDHMNRPCAALHQRRCQPVKITPLPGQAVHANHHMRSPGIAPGPPGHAVLPLRMGTDHGFKTGLKHGGNHKQKQTSGGPCQAAWQSGHNGFFIIVMDTEKTACSKVKRPS
mgnify:CR=1 FL=1